MKKFFFIFLFPLTILSQVQEIRLGAGGSVVDTNLFVAKAGDTMTGALVLPNISNALAFTNDVYIMREAANTLALRNGANAQSFNMYNTYTDAANYESVRIGWGQTANTFSIRTAKAGTGLTRGIDIRALGILSLGGGNTVSWNIPTTGHLLAQSDNTYDIGASGATRPRTIYAGADIIAGRDITAGAGNQFTWGTTRSTMASPSDGIIRLANAATTDFSRLQFGGITTNFPALSMTKGAGTLGALSVVDATGGTNVSFVIPQKTPASSSETNYVGTICWDASYIYVWTATNVNKRVALSTW